MGFRGLLLDPERRRSSCTRLLSEGDEYNARISWYQPHLRQGDNTEARGLFYRLWRGGTLKLVDRDGNPIYSGYLWHGHESRWHEHRGGAYCRPKGSWVPPRGVAAHL